MSQFLKISQQTLWQIIGKIVTSFSTFIILGLVARNYGPSGTGVFTLALTYLAIFYLLADFGFNAHVLKVTSNKVSFDQSRNKQVTSYEFQKLLGTRIIWSGILVILSIGLLPLLPFASSLFAKAVLFGVPAIIFSGIYTTCNLIFQSKLRYDLSIIASGVGTLLSLVVFVFLVKNTFPVSYLLLGHLFGWLVTGLAALILVKIASSHRVSNGNPSALRAGPPRNDDRIFPIFDIRYAINLFKTSWPIAATLAVNVVYFRADAFMVSFYKGLSDVGFYNVAYQIFQSALVLPTFIMNSYYPLMLKSFSGIRQIAGGLLAIALVLSLITYHLSPVIIHLLAGNGFGRSVNSLQILSLGFPAYFLSSLLMWVLVAKGRYRLMFSIYAAGLLVNLLLNFLYIPRYSFIAASWTTVLSEYLILTLQAGMLASNK